MTFSRKGKLILVSSSRPGQHATLFDHNGAKVPFRGDDSIFNDVLRSYTWAFDAALFPSYVFVFATGEEHVVGEVENGEIRVVRSDRARILRKDGKPVGVEF